MERKIMERINSCLVALRSGFALGSNELMARMEQLKLWF